MWSHRILAHKHPTTGEVHLQIHEVFYNEKGELNSYTKEGVTVNGDSLRSIKWVLNKMNKCCDKPIIWAGENFPLEVEKSTIKLVCYNCGNEGKEEYDGSCCETCRLCSI